jgi:hypothetical protein
MDDKIKVIADYKYFIKKNEIILPENLKEKRKIFIDYFINKESSANITQSIDDLSSNYLYITSKTIEEILFYK